MAFEVKKRTLEVRGMKFNALLFLPDEGKSAESVALITHGYTSQKNSILAWPARLIDEGVASVLFDLPGHYMGAYHEVSSFDEFTTHAPECFEAAWQWLLSEYPIALQKKLVLAGHSLGALLSLLAVQNEVMTKKPDWNLCVGFGFPPKTVTHLFETPLYQKTLELRGQIVAPAISPDRMFPWIKEAKQNLNFVSHQVYLLSGEDDLVVGTTGLEELEAQLKQNGNIVVVEKPKRLPHHTPDLAAGHLKQFFKNQNLL